MPAVMLAPLVAMLCLGLNVLTPAKKWHAPQQPQEIRIKHSGPVRLQLSDLAGRLVAPQVSPEVAGDATIDLTQMFILRDPGAYVLRAFEPSAPDEAGASYLGTPLVVSVRRDPRPLAADRPKVVSIEPMEYGQITTSRGEMTVGFYYDSAPNTVQNFISLAEGGFYDGLPFNRILPGILIQTGDPIGDGTGGPGYFIDAEFTDRQHLAGVLSMARLVDPIEPADAAPRPEFANSAGSQFFICLNNDRTRQLDRRYTAFARVADGIGVARAIGSSAVADPLTGRPADMASVTSIKILPVDFEHDPYKSLYSDLDSAATQPAEVKTGDADATPVVPSTPVPPRDATSPR